MRSNYKNLSKLRLNKKSINIINVDYKYKKIFDQISNKSNNYINTSFKIALKLLKKNKNISLINGPINKKTFLKKKHLGMTEFMQKKTHSKNTAMLIYNSNFAVCPITTHTPVKNIVKPLFFNGGIDFFSSSATSGYENQSGMLSPFSNIDLNFVPEMVL